MPLQTRKFASFESLDTFLKGGIVVGGGIRNQVDNRGKIYGLDGLTLVFTTPAGTVTFADATQAGLTIGDIVSQIKVATPTVTARMVSNELHILQDTLASAVVLNAGSSTAADKLGFTEAGSISGTLYNAPDGVVPRLIRTESSPQGDGVWVITEEI